MTDNHWSYTKSRTVADILADLDAAHITIRPHCPWQNGKVERFHRTLQIERAYRQVFTSNDERNKRCQDGSSTTTTDADTARSADDHRSAECHQPDVRVHLAGDRDDGLAAGVAAGDVVDGRCRLGQRVGPIDDRSQLSAFDQPGEVEQVLSAHR